MDVEMMWTVTKLVTAITRAMTPEQLREAAANVRAIEPNDEIEREFLAGMAKSLDRYATETEAEDSTSAP